MKRLNKMFQTLNKLWVQLKVEVMLIFWGYVSNQSKFTDFHHTVDANRITDVNWNKSKALTSKQHAIEKLNNNNNDDNFD